MLITNVLSEDNFLSKLLPTILALMVAHLQMDVAEVNVQRSTATEPLVTCVAEMFGLSLILAAEIVLIQVMLCREDNSAHETLKVGVCIIESLIA